MKLVVEFPEPELFSSAHQFAVFLSNQRFEATVREVKDDQEDVFKAVGPLFTSKAPPVQEFVVTQA